MKNPCKKCNAKCCKYIAIEIDYPKEKEDLEDLKWYVLHKNIKLYIDNDDDFILEFKTKCKALDKDNMCKIYKKRPKICRNYKTNNCENNEGDTHKILFKTPKDIENYFKSL